MQQVQPNQMVLGQNYFIEMVGFNLHRLNTSGKAIGVNYIGSTTWGALTANGVPRNIRFGNVGEDIFHNNDILVMFQNTIAVKPGPCDICRYTHFRSSDTNGFKFFKVGIKRLQINNFLKGKKLAKKHIPGVLENIQSYLGGKKTRRKKKRKKTRRRKKRKKTRRRKNK